jgi:hypothetical protein
MTGNMYPYDRYIERYPQGGKARVYYNPDNPEQSVLEPGENDIRPYFVLALFLTICGILHIVNYSTGFGEDFISFFEGSND